jgi:hypothetical protein
LDLAASEGEASERERTPAMAKEQSRRLIILYKMQEKCHFANRMAVGNGMYSARSKISWRRPALAPWDDTAFRFQRHEGVPSPDRAQRPNRLDKRSLPPFLQGC